MSRHRFAVLGFVLAVASACITDLEPDPDSVSLDEVLQLTNQLDPAVLPADGTSEDLLTARIPRASRERGIAFKTTAGTLIPGGGTESTVRATPDPDDPAWLKATVRLRSDTVATTAFAQASIGGFTDTLSIAFITPEPR